MPDPVPSPAVFLGPSLDRDQAAALLPVARFLPPVRLGDVCTAVLKGHQVLVIIDGVFEQVPTVWHKEILWALTRGCAVYGAASMGALRAAELAPFGMCGVGTVYERFRDGTYNDDDEVTIIHAADDDLGYRALSAAMASIRVALEEAVAEGVCTAAEAAELVARSKARHYSTRSWPLVLRDAVEVGLDEDRVGRLRAALRDRPDAKARDAVAVLRRAAADLAAGTRPPVPAFEFEPTYNFEKLLAIVRAELAERAVRERSGVGSAEVRRAEGLGELSLLQFLVRQEADRLGLAAAPAPGRAAEVAGVADAAGATAEVVEETLRLESYRLRLEQRHLTELARFTETARLATIAAAVGGGEAEPEGMRSQESNRLDDGRVVR